MEEQVAREMTPQEKCHDLRKKIDALIQYAGMIKNDNRSEYASFKREIAIVYTKLQEAKMWTGKCLEMQGSELPKEFQDKMEANPIKLMLGEPRKGERGYTTIDIGHEADVHFDLNNPLTDLYEENSVDSIGAFHLVEHLRPTKIRQLIKSWVEVLKPGGIMNIECPDFDGCIEWYRKEKSLLSKQWIFGDDSREGQHHFWGFNQDELEDIFRELPVRYSFAEPQDYHKEQGPCLRIEIVKV